MISFASTMFPKKSPMLYHEPICHSFFNKCGKTHNLKFTIITIKFFILILERQKGREKERERNIDVRNVDGLPFTQTLTGD